MAGFIGPMIGAVLLVLWWLFASRLFWVDRLIVPLALAIYGAAIMFVGHETIGVFGILLFALPTATAVWIGWLVISYPLRWPIRRVGLAVVLMLVAGYFTLIRNDGVTGAFASAIKWRWTPREEDKFLADHAARELPKAPPEEAKAGPLTLRPGDWPAFRGPNRDGRLVGVKIPTDMDQHPPKLLWRQKVGPGWGSFAVVGKHVFTQEQWDQDEAVVCYDAGTGKIIWFHKDPARFTEVVAGPGPRATPTFQDGKLYTMGAAGKLCCLDAATGREVWAQNIIANTGATLPQWGFSASPLVLQGMVMVFAGGPNKAVVAYDAATGKFAWAAGEGKASYCSLQRAAIDGVEQALMATGDGLIALQPKDGKVIWDYKWSVPNEGARCTQPAAVGDADFLLGTPFNGGTRRLHLSKDNDQWSTTKVWDTRAISPYFNDLVVHRNNIYGFTGEFFACVNLDKGKLQWKERGYGCGQVLLLVDQDLLLIVTETGKVALVDAAPGERKELASFQAIEGKTWNHPVIAHGKLFVRNAEEAACYQLMESKIEAAKK